MTPDVHDAHQRRSLWLSLLAFALVFVIWNVPTLRDSILYPVNLFVTYVHEAGHGTAAILTGGRFISFEINANGGGVAMTQGGARWLILPAGYIGSALFGAVLFYLVNRYHRTQAIAMGLGALLIGFSLVFGLGSLTALIVGILFGLALMAAGNLLPTSVTLVILNLLAILTSQNAVLDIISLIGNTDARLGAIHNDAAAFSREVAPLIPASVWAFLWAAIAVGLLLLSFWLSVIRPIRRRG
jgi:Peptidase M50B-like